MKNHEEIGTPVYNHSGAMVRGRTGSEHVQNAREGCIYTPEGNQPSYLFSVVKNVTSMDTEETTNLTIKLEPDLDDLKIENVPLETAKSDIGDIKPETRLLLLKYHKMICNILREHSYCAASSSSYTKVGKNIENTVKQTFFGIENSRAVNDSETLHGIDYNDWKIKNEEVDLKEDDLEQKVISSLPVCLCQDTPKQTFEPDHSTVTKRELNTCSNGSSKEQLLQHNSEVHNRFKRDIYEIDSKFGLNNHILRCHNSEEFKRGPCLRQTVRKNTSNLHSLQQLNRRKTNVFKCIQCNYKTIHESNLTRHKKAECKPLKCNHCEYRTIQKSNLTTHMLRHKNPEQHEKFKCYVCQYETFKKKCLKRHVLRHRSPEERERFKCDVCDQILYKCSLKVHMLKHKRETFQCYVCKYQTLDKRALKKHMLQHKNPEKGKQFKCDRCGYQTFVQSYFKKHLLRHKNPEEREKFECNVCKFRSFYKNTLKHHMLWHKNPEERKKFKCDVCEYQALRHRTLKAHMRKHVNLEGCEKYKCDVCKYQTPHKSHLKTHVLWHENPEKYVYIKHFVTVT